MKFKTFVTVTAVLTFFLILLGGYVKATGAGASCGAQWPKCHGEWFPANMTRLDWLEWTHRLVASTVGPLILAVGVWAWMTERANKPVLVAAVTSAVLLPLQILMGGATVLAYGASTPAAQEVSVVVHLGFASLIFAGLVVTAVMSHFLPSPREFDVESVVSEAPLVQVVGGKRA